MIHIRKVYKSFGEVNALSEVSLDIQDGELFVLIGPDGAGKTTLFRMLVTLLVPDYGSIEVNGLDVVENFRQLRTKMGYMPGTFSLYPDLTVEENLEFYASIFGTTIRKNYDLIRDIYKHIEPFKKRPAGKLSGGMKQKLALSCALIHRPEVLVLDEPTTGVDAASRKEFWIMLKKIQQEGMTIIASTAYMDEAVRGDRSGFLHQGKLLMADTPGKIREEYPYPMYSCRSENNYALLQAIRAESSTATALLFGKTIHYSPVKEDFPVEELMSGLEATGKYGRITCEKTKPELEDSFSYLSKGIERSETQSGMTE